MNLGEDYLSALRTGPRIFKIPIVLPSTSQLVMGLSDAQYTRTSIFDVSIEIHVYKTKSTKWIWVVSYLEEVTILWKVAFALWRGSIERLTQYQRCLLLRWSWVSKDTFFNLFRITAYRLWKWPSCLLQTNASCTDSYPFQNGGNIHLSGNGVTLWNISISSIEAMN